jgi:cytochrome c
VGIHAASDTEYDWKWYGALVGGYFRNHPPGTPTAMVDVEDTDDHSTAGLPVRWQRTDEWYNFKPLNFEQAGNVDFSPRNNPVHVLLRMDESTYVEQDGSDGVDDDHPISWCQAYDGGRSWYTGMGHTEASFVEAGFLSHILGGIQAAAGEVAAQDCGFSVRTDEPVDVGGVVPGTLALSVSPTADLGAFVPGMGRDYEATLTANVITTAEATTLTVHDPSANAAGRLVNGSFALAEPLQAKATNAANPAGAFAPVGSDPLTLLQYPAPISNDAVTIGLRQSIGANEALRTGRYGKTLTFTLSTNQP